MAPSSHNQLVVWLLRLERKFDAARELTRHRLTVVHRRFKLPLRYGTRRITVEYTTRLCTHNVDVGYGGRTRSFRCFDPSYGAPRA